MPTERGYVHTAQLNDLCLADLLRERFEDSPAIVRSLAQAEFVTVNASESSDFLGQWPQGQVFNESAELRWRQTGQDYAVLLLVEHDDEVPEFHQLPHSPFTVTRPSHRHNHGFLLWGTRRATRETGETWWETRIPRPLTYPRRTSGDDGTRQNPLRLLHRLYLKNGAVRWVRLVGLREVE